MTQKIWIALIGPSWVGKTTIGKILAGKLGMHFHDIDDEGLEGAWGEWWVARVLAERGDEGFLKAENDFIKDNYGPKSSGSTYTLYNMILATPGSLVLEREAIDHIKKHMVLVYLDLEMDEIVRRAKARGVSRIVGMNGDTPRFDSLEAVIAYRKEYYERYAELTCRLEVWCSPEEDALKVYQFIKEYINRDYEVPSLLQDSRSSERMSLRNAIITSQPYSWGLWCPKYFPQVSPETLQNLVWGSYQNLAKYILGLWNFWVSRDSLGQVIDSAYGAQWYRKEITPVKHISDNIYSLHLWYGPTFAFKNIALEFLPRILSAMCPDKKIHVLWASSGDTINAAHSGVKGTNIYSLFMLPSKGPSVVQRLQAEYAISDNPNAFTLLAEIPFDPLQDIVKRINSEEYRNFKERYSITSFNSINIARILAQSVYYFRAYLELISQKSLSYWEKVVFSVPSWNFWDALAGYYALKMGLPIRGIHIATNENDMLDVFLKTWRYEPPKREGKDYIEVTNAPSMDIAKSSNFERMLYDITDWDYELVASWYNNLKELWYFEVWDEILSRIQAMFSSSSSTNSERLEAIEYFAEKYQHGVDPHTAAALVPCMKWEIDSTLPYIFLETSHIAQFASELKDAWVDVPDMYEFDSEFASMKDKWTWSNVMRTSHDFDSIFPDIENALKSFTSKF